MSQTHTIAVRFPEGVVPRYSAATEFQGGQVVAVNFAGNRMDVADEFEEALERLFDLANHFHVSGVYFSEDPENYAALLAAAKALGKSRRQP